MKIYSYVYKGFQKRKTKHVSQTRHIMATSHVIVHPSIFKTTESTGYITLSYLELSTVNIF